MTAGTEYTYSVTAQDAAGNVSGDSNTATETAATGPKTVTVNRFVTRHQGTNSSTVAVTGLTTTATNELLLLHELRRAQRRRNRLHPLGGWGGPDMDPPATHNTQAGTAEIWQAVSPAPLSNATVTATQNRAPGSRPCPWWPS